MEEWYEQLMGYFISSHRGQLRFPDIEDFEFMGAGKYFESFGPANQEPGKRVAEHAGAGCEKAERPSQSEKTV